MGLRSMRALALRAIIALLIVTTLAGAAGASKMLIYMDLDQTDHLKAYGVAFWALEQGFGVEWLLN